MLTKEELAAAVEHVSALGTASQYQEKFVREDLLKVNGAAYREDAEGKRLMIAVIQGMEDFVTRDMINSVNSERVYLVHSEICNATAVKLNGREPAVILFTGLLRALIYFMEVRHVVGVIAGELKAPSPRIEISRNELSILSFRAMMLLCHSVATRSRLVRVGGFLPDKSKSSLALIFARAFWFLLMHEIGHVRLNHFDCRTGSDAAGPQALAVGEDINDRKLQEFEADGYYLSTLTKGSLHYSLNYVLDILTIFSFLENHLRSSSASHPMAINRLEHILGRYGKPEDTFILDRARTLIKSEKRARQTAEEIFKESGGWPRLDAFATRAQSVDAAGQLVDLLAAIREPEGNKPVEDGASLPQFWEKLVARWW